MYWAAFNVDPCNPPNNQGCKLFHMVLEKEVTPQWLGLGWNQFWMTSLLAKYLSLVLTLSY